MLKPAAVTAPELVFTNVNLARPVSISVGPSYRQVSPSKTISGVASAAATGSSPPPAMENVAARHGRHHRDRCQSEREAASTRDPR
jgi:hypothetical protein